MDIQASLKETDQTFTEFLLILASVREDQINTIPFKGSWTAGQLAQHIVLSAGGFVQLINGPFNDTNRDPELHSANITATFLNFNIKMQSPDFINPPVKEYHQQELIHTLQDIKADLLKAIQKTDPTLTCTAFEVPVLGYLTRAEAITFTIVHTQRHINQLKNINKNL
ncbi:DinB family protein [Mucilaginibacter paludis]|uniref:DinB-like domain-containing protein n=1 Tax=Mucilaginibacter paludis DSM 18603 TaxID=714943 RepID=H1YB79_9SPHI|nr:DinB family protein [Mucilaginibacter paludis]EHQ30605.1 hypothetical protein Mucpa_6552 [Mucilaginibacter paludis DSM 18603]